MMYCIGYVERNAIKSLTPCHKGIHPSWHYFSIYMCMKKNIKTTKQEPDLIDDESTVSKEEAQLIEKTADSQAGPEDLAWEQSTLDNTDEDGEPLNEETEFSGKDLDVPGSEDDDENEEVGSEDEENNSYSIGGEKKD